MMSERKRRFLTAVPAVAAALIAASILIPQPLLGDSLRGALVGIGLGSSIVALIKLKVAGQAD
jgi:hypothetical protein